MAGKAWTPERRAAEAARRANEAAQKLQASGVKPEFQPDTDMTNGEVGRVKTRNPQWGSLDEVEAMSDERSGMQRPEPEPEAETAPKEAKPETTEPNAAAEPNVPEAETPPSNPEATAAAPEATATPEPPKTVKQVVDGKDYEVALSEIEEAGGERAWRIERAAKNRLEANNAALAETRRIQAQAVAFAQQQAQQQQQAQPQYTDAQLLEYMRTGTPEQAQAAWGLMKQGLTVDRAGITNEAAFKSNQRGAIERFQAEFQDVLANPHMARLAAVYENERIAKGLHEAGILQWNGSQLAVNWADPRIAAFDFSKVYRSIGNELRSTLPRQSQPPASPGTTTGTPSQPSDKEARKASIVTLPTAATPRAAPPAEEKPQSHREILAEEAKARNKIAPHG